MAWKNCSARGGAWNRVQQRVLTGPATVLVDANQLETGAAQYRLECADAMQEWRQRQDHGQADKVGLPVTSIGGGAANGSVKSLSGTAGGGPHCRRASNVRITVMDTVSAWTKHLGQGHRTILYDKGPGKGTGLGLSMVHGLAAQSAGPAADPQ